MTDIVERLRGKPAPGDHCSKLIAEAADEIERLEAHPADELLLEENKLMRAALLSQSDEIERLRAVILDGCQVFEHYDLPEHAFHYRRQLDRSSDRPRDDGTVVAFGGEPGASAGKSE
jgi:hypothetical protein